VLTKNSFTEAEWNTLRETPHLVGTAIMMAGASGLGTVKETFTLAQTVLGGSKSELPLIRDLSSASEAQAAQTAIRETAGKVDPGKVREELQRISLERVRSSIALIGAKGNADEVLAFRNWLWEIGEGVAKAAREGGFLGFGGTEVSEGEMAYLDQLKTALQLQAQTARTGA